MKIDSDLNENNQTIFSSNNFKKKELIITIKRKQIKYLMIQNITLQLLMKEMK